MRMLARLENEIRAAGLNVLGTEYGAEGATISLGVFDRPEELARAEELVVSEFRIRRA